jgi:DNA-binding Lrp family transcriptional regulator
MQKVQWTFLTNHAQVFLCIAQNDHITAREIATIVGITERAVQRILDDLEHDGYIQRFREGRSNRYSISLDMPLRHPAQHGQPVRDLLAVLLKLPPKDETPQQ